MSLSEVQGLVDVLYRLLPGFLAAAVFHTLTPHPKRDVLERIVTALLFTLFASLGADCVRTVSVALGRSVGSLGAWTDTSQVLVASVVGVMLAVLLSFVSNRDAVHRYLRRWGITHRTSLPTQWYSAFSTFDKHYAVLALTGDRRLYGWLREWPDSAECGHFIVQQAAWILPDGEVAELYELEAMLVPVSEVESVEFVRQSNDPARLEHAEEIKHCQDVLVNLRSKGDSDEQREEAEAPAH